VISAVGPGRDADVDVVDVVDLEGFIVILVPRPDGPAVTLRVPVWVAGGDAVSVGVHLWVRPVSSG
jgi:hypothetical protein